MRQLAWYLKQNSDRGSAGDVVGRGTLREPFQIAVSSPAGTVDRLTVTGAQFNHLFAWSEIQIPGGPVAIVAVQSEESPEFLFVKGSPLAIQTEVRLVSPVAIATPLTNEVCIVTDMPAPEVQGATEAYLELDADDGEKLKNDGMIRDGSSKMRFKIQGGKLLENADDRQLMTVKVNGESGEVVTTVQVDPIDVVFEVVDDKGARRNQYDDPDFIVQLSADHWASVPIDNGRGTLALSRTEYGVFKFGSSDQYSVAEPLRLIIASV